MRKSGGRSPKPKASQPKVDKPVSIARPLPQDPQPLPKVTRPKREVLPHQARQDTETFPNGRMLIAVTTYQRPQTITRLLQTLCENSSPQYRSQFELVISDDASSVEVSKRVLEEARNFTTLTGIKSTILLADKRVGRARNKNRLLWWFLNRSTCSEILLCDDDLAFIHPEWYTRLRNTLLFARTYPIGFSINMKGEDDSAIPGAYVQDVPPTKAFVVDKVTTSQIGYLRDFGYVLGQEVKDFLQRANRAKGRKPNLFHVVPNTQGCLIDQGVDKEDWDIDAAEHTEEFYQSDKPSEQRHPEHGIPDIEIEWSKAHTYQKNMGEPTVTIPRQATNAPQVGYRAPTNFTPRVHTTDARVTVIIGHRGTGERLRNLLHVLDSIDSQTEKVRVIVVEQDTLPYARAEVEYRVDDYVFCYSDRPYNRAWAFNVGVVRTNSPFVLLHDGDLLMPPGYVHNALNLLGNRDAAVPWKVISYLNMRSSEEYPQGPMVTEKMVDNFCIHGGSTLLRRQWLLQVQGMDERCEGWGAEDDILFEKMIKMGTSIQAQDPLDHNLIHLWHQPQDLRRECFLKNRKIWEEYAHASGHNLPMVNHHAKMSANPDLWKPTLKQSGQEPKELTRVHIIYDVEGWAYYHRAKALQKYAPDDVEITLSKDLPGHPVDIILLLNYSIVDRVAKALRGTSTKLIGGINTGWPRRLSHAEDIYNKCDYVIINNREMYQRLGELPRTFTISNAIEPEIFSPQINPPTRHLVPPNRHKVLSIGSQYHAGLKGLTTVLPHTVDRLSNHQIETDFKVIDSHQPKFSLHDMSRWYHSGTIYVVASENEGTPNPALEAAACGLVVVSTEVGNMPEFIKTQQNGVLVKRDPNSIVDGILYAVENYERLREASLAAIGEWFWESRSKRYYDLFRRIAVDNPPGREWNYPDGVTDPPSPKPPPTDYDALKRPSNAAMIPQTRNQIAQKMRAMGLHRTPDTPKTRRRKQMVREIERKTRHNQ